MAIVNNFNKEQNQHLFSTLSNDEQNVLMAIHTEYITAKRLWPAWPDDKIHAAAVVAEEAVELVQAALQSHYQNAATQHMLTEAIQTGAMAMRFIINHKK